MIVDKKWMEENFLKFNELYFKNELPLPKLGVSRSRTRMGSMTCKRKSTLFGGRKFTDFAIHLTIYYEMTERQAQNILIHEMIHYHIAYNRIKDTSPHGVKFRSIAKFMNDKYGWEITISTNARGWKVADDAKSKGRKNVKPKEFLVLATKMRDNTYYLSCVNPVAFRMLDNQFSRISGVDKFCWYKTDNEYFATFPRVRTPRGRRVTKEVYDHYISIMTKLG